MPLILTLKQGGSFYVGPDRVEILSVEKSFFIVKFSNGSTQQVWDDMMYGMPNNNNVRIGKGKYRPRDPNGTTRVLITAPKDIVISREFPLVSVASKVIDVALRLGVGGDPVTYISRMVFYAVPHSEVKGFNLRYRNFLLCLDNGKVINIALYNPEVPTRSKNKGICYDCGDDGGFCLTCNDGTV